jgi:ribosomal protein S12 methylthiotransferase
MRPSLVEAIAGTPGVAPYFDLSFQHASASLLRRMRRFGDVDSFLDLLHGIRRIAPDAGVRSNFIVGFPGETKADHADLVRFLTAARLDAAGFFAYSDEDGTEAAGLSGKVRRDVITRRLARVTELAESLTAERAEERVGAEVEVLVETVEGDRAEGRAAHQAPEVDGSVTVTGAGLRVGDLVRARVRRAAGVDLDADVVAVVTQAGAAAAVAS